MFDYYLHKMGYIQLIFLFQKFFLKQIFFQDFTYDSIENQFDLKKYEREIQNNLTETATDKLIIKLSNIK